MKRRRRKRECTYSILLIRKTIVVLLVLKADRIFTIVRTRLQYTEHSLQTVEIVLIVYIAVLTNSPYLPISSA